jgi:MipA family protein
VTSAPSRLAHSLCCLICFVAGPAASADVQVEQEKKPLWELGLGGGALALADYRGADTAHAYPIPVPYFVYRGSLLRADRNGVRGVLFDQKRLELNIGVNATPPVNSRHSRARQDMPDLKPTLELGPSLDLHVWRSDNEHARVDLRLPLRAAVTVQSPPKFIGWVFAPHLNLDLNDVGGLAGWNLGMLAGPLYASRRYNEYFYTVGTLYSRPDRPAYRATGGYSGMQALVSLSKRFDRYWVGGFVRYDTLRGAVFDDSPLVRSRGYWVAGIGIAWMLGRSSKLVSVDVGGP